MRRGGGENAAKAKAQAGETTTSRAVRLGGVVAAVAAVLLVLSATAPGRAETCPTVEREPSLVWMALRGAAPKVVGGKGDAVQAVKELKGCAQAYAEAFPTWTLLLYVAMYVSAQMFAVPGPPLMLSVLSGVLWPSDLLVAQAAIAFCATSGASACYSLSKTLDLGPVVKRLDPARFDRFKDAVEREAAGGDLFNFLLFIRLTPFFPNWFVNLVSPMLGVPLRTFAAATLVGLIPNNVMWYQLGNMLETYDPSKPMDKSEYMTAAALMALAAITPPLVKRYFAGRFQMGSSSSLGESGGRHANENGSGSGRRPRSRSAPS